MTMRLLMEEPPKTPHYVKPSATYPGMELPKKQMRLRRLSEMSLSLSRIKNVSV